MRLGTLATGIYIELGVMALYYSLFFNEGFLSMEKCLAVNGYFYYSE